MSAKKYNQIAVFLHWLMAISFFLMLASGFYMKNFVTDLSFKYKLYQWHKSLGLLLLCLAIYRIFWRLKHQPPSLPNQFNQFTQKLARLGHISFYFWMLMLPLTGWIIVSSSYLDLPTYIFGLFEWPHITFIADNEKINEFAILFHFVLALSFLFMIVIHIFAFLKHLIIDKVNLLKRIWF